MITLLPSFRETLVLPRKAKDTSERLLVSTSNKPFLQPDESELLFSGWVNPDRFRIALRLRRQNHFIPLAMGKIDATTSGCLITLHYRLFPVTRLLLQAWSVLLVAGGVIALYPFQNYLASLAAAATLILIHIVARSNFRIQLQLTREAIHRVVA